MEARKTYEEVKLFCGIIYSDEDIIEAVIGRIKETIGESDCSAGPFDFDSTEYYREDMGDGLKKRFISFKNTVSPENLCKWKILTNEIEKEFYGGRYPRKINLDPGYLNLSRVILFSAKDFYHRIYLGKGIFAEVTLYFEKNRFMFLPWTYPDYKSSEYLKFFLKMRNIYKSQIERAGLKAGESILPYPTESDK